MGSPAPNAFFDKIDASPMGVHSGLPPDLLSMRQQWFAVNTTFRGGGHPRTRPAIRKLAISYPDDETTQERATEAIFQGAKFYQGFGDIDSCLVASIGGRVFRYRINNSNVQCQELTSSSVNNPILEQAWLFQGEQFLFINDGKDLPFIFNGATLRRSAGPEGQELPAGCMGAYVNGRIVMALPDRRSYIAGDLVGTSTDAILKTTENEAILGGASFAIPINAGPINAMFSVAIPDTSLGQGLLHIGTSTTVFSTNLPLDATLWTTLDQPTQVVSLPGTPGPRSHFGVAQVNGDAWYRANDGLRSFMVGRRDLATSWVQTPMSYEMEAILPFDTEALLGHSSLARFSNRLLATCSPYRVSDRGIAHRGMVALDFNNISSVSLRSQPNYDGLWTGLPIFQIVTGIFDDTERCFLFALDGDNKICLYELLKDEAAFFDFDGAGDVQIESFLISNGLFGREDLPEKVQVPLKKLSTVDLFADKLAGTVEFDFKYRPDTYPFWVDWRTFEICAPAEDCTTSGCPTFEDVQQQYATYQRLPDPIDQFNPVTKQNFRTGYYFQLRVQWTGHAEIHKILAWSTPIPETVPNVPGNSECTLLKGCGENYFSYEIEP